MEVVKALLSSLFTIDVQLYLFTAGLTLALLVAAWQAGRLHNEYRSRSSVVGALAFLLLALRQVYAMLTLRSAIADARTRGFMIEQFTLEQWLTLVIWPYIVAGLFIWWLTWKRIENRRLVRDAPTNYNVE